MPAAASCAPVQWPPLELWSALAAECRQRAPLGTLAVIPPEVLRLIMLLAGGTTAARAAASCRALWEVICVTPCGAPWLGDVVLLTPDRFLRRIKSPSTVPGTGHVFRSVVRHSKQRYLMQFPSGQFWRPTEMILEEPVCPPRDSGVRGQLSAELYAQTLIQPQVQPLKNTVKTPKQAATAVRGIVMDWVSEVLSDRGRQELFRFDMPQECLHMVADVWQHLLRVCDADKPTVQLAACAAMLYVAQVCEFPHVTASGLAQMSRNSYRPEQVVSWAAKGHKAYAGLLPVGTTLHYANLLLRNSAAPSGVNSNELAALARLLADIGILSPRFNQFSPLYRATVVLNIAGKILDVRELRIHPLLCQAEAEACAEALWATCKVQYLYYRHFGGSRHSAPPKAPPTAFLMKADAGHPEAVRVTVPEDVEWTRLGGVYERTGLSANGLPVWVRGDNNYYLYGASDGTWAVGGRDVRKRGFRCTAGWVISKDLHNGQGPDRMKEWEGWTGQIHFYDSRIKVTAERRNEEGRALDALMGYGDKQKWPKAPPKADSHWWQLYE